MSSEIIEEPGTSLANSSESQLTQMLSSHSISSIESAVSCRICKFAGGADLITSPCHCKGSMGLVHVSCLEEWLKGSTRDSCELCSGTYKVIRTPKYSFCQSVWIFFWNKINILRLVRDLIFLTVSVVNTCILLCLWFTYTFKEMSNIFGQKESQFKSVMMATPFRGLSYFFFFTLCLVFVSVNAVDDCRRIFYYYFLPWYYWWQSSVEVKLILNTDNKEHPKNQ